MSELYPLDFDALTKGDVIDRGRLESIYNVRKQAAPDAYHLCQLRLCSDIERARSDLLCCISGDTVRVLTDAEGDEHTWKEHKRAVRKMERQVRRRRAIDLDKLTENQRKVAELRDAHVTAQALINRRALTNAQREMRLLPGASEDE